MGWKQLERRISYDSPYMTVWEDTVELPSGQTINDFSGVNLPDGVLVVATDEDDNLLLFEEYKYAVNDTVLTFPAGGIDGSESPEAAALRELKEETGYEASEAKVLTHLYPYPSKITHTNYIVRVTNAVRATDLDHSDTEVDSIGQLQRIPLHELSGLIAENRFTTSYMVAALALAFPEHFSKVN
jgi:ADP-ribose pyrophosphatase